jgi:hypothetical protein
VVIGHTVIYDLVETKQEILPDSGLDVFKSNFDTSSIIEYILVIQQMHLSRAVKVVP